MLNLRDRPIRQKIMLVIMLISGVVLLLAFAALFYFKPTLYGSSPRTSSPSSVKSPPTIVPLPSCSKTRMPPRKSSAG